MLQELLKSGRQDFLLILWSMVLSFLAGIPNTTIPWQQGNSGFQLRSWCICNTEFAYSTHTHEIAQFWITYVPQKIWMKLKSAVLELQLHELISKQNSTHWLADTFGAVVNRYCNTDNKRGRVVHSHYRHASPPLPVRGTFLHHVQVDVSARPPSPLYTSLRHYYTIWSWNHTRSWLDIDVHIQIVITVQDGVGPTQACPTNLWGNISIAHRRCVFLKISYWAKEIWINWNIRLQ